MLKITRMDTKRNQSEAYKTNSAIRVKSFIEKWRPDVVIASDDNASKYLIAPYFKDKKLPFVFCGVNWDASVYGFPCRNVTGMEEVSFVIQTIETLKSHAGGNRLGVIAADVLSERKTVENIKKKFGLKFEKEYFSKTYSEWKSQFKRLQTEVDMILFTCHTGITDWDDKDARAFVMNHTSVPIGTMDEWVIDYALIAFTKIPSAQGEWAGQVSLKILNGTPPLEIPIVQNKRVKIILNMKLANKLGISFPTKLISVAQSVH